MNDNYEVGDTIYIFNSRYGVGHTLIEGTVHSITPSGRINVLTEHGVRRFMPLTYNSSREVGSGSSWNSATIVSKNAQDEKAALYKRLIWRKELEDRFLETLNSIPRKMEGKETEILDALAKLRTIVEKGYATPN